VPDDPPIAHASGPDPDRILMLGGRVIRGLGVASHELGIAGSLARQLAARTRRGADIEARGIPNVTARGIADELRRQRLDRFDLVILMVGSTEVISMRPRRLWRRDVARLLDAVAEIMPKAVPVLIVSIPYFAKDVDVPPVVQRAITRKITRFNAETLRACEDAQGVDFVPLAPSPEGVAREVGSALYAGWARQMVPAADRALAAAAPAQQALPFPVADESDRQHALDALGVVYSGSNPAVNHIVEMARGVFGVSAASVTLIDHDTQHVKAASGIGTDPIARDESFCNTTIQHPGVYIVEDVDLDPQFSDAAWVAGPDHLRFYAGYPLEAPGGQRIGALCVMDRAPRHFDAADVAMLRDLALSAQRELWSAGGGAGAGASVAASRTRGRR